MIDQGVLERMALANGAEDSRNAREWLATSRENLGDPVASPPSLKPPRWVTAGSEEPPEGRKRFLAGNIEEHWHPEYAPAESMSEAIRPRLRGWNVTQRWRSPWCDCTHATFEPMFIGANMTHDLVHKGCGRRAQNKRGNTPMGEHIRSLQFQAMSDEDYNMFYPGLPGNDLIHGDLTKQGLDIWKGGQVWKSRPDWGKDGSNPQYAGDSIELRGGKEITQGRREYRQHMKEHNMIHVDDGYWPAVERAKVEREAKAEERLNDIAERAASDLPERMGQI
jgi:hypothetical protein